MDKHVLDETITQAYERIWGPFSDQLTMRGDLETIEVYKWLEPAPKAANGILATYCTLGAARHPYHNRRVEVSAGLSPQIDEAAEALAALATTPELARLAHGSTVKLDASLWPGTEMCGFLILDNNRLIAPIPLEDGSHVDFIKVLPLYAEEILMCREQGHLALLRSFREHDVQFWNPFRRVKATGISA